MLEWQCAYCSSWLCRGKLLNVRDASAAQIANNVEIQNIKQIMGLQHGKVDPQPFTFPAGDLCCCSQRSPQDPFPNLKFKLVF